MITFVFIKLWKVSLKKPFFHFIDWIIIPRKTKLNMTEGGTNTAKINPTNFLRLGLATSRMCKQLLRNRREQSSDFKHDKWEFHIAIKVRSGNC